MSKLVFKSGNCPRYWIEVLFYYMNPLGGTPLCDLNGDVQPDRAWLSGCFVLNGYLFHHFLS